MRVGVALPHYGDDVRVDRVVGVAASCEHLGFDSVWVSDHLTFDMAKYGGSADEIGVLEPLTTLAAIAESTSRVRLGTMVLCNEFRNPLVLAKAAATIDQMSEGRLELGLGAGWYDREFAAAGLDMPRPGVRLARLAESIEILKALFDGDPVTYRGEHYTLDGALVRPRPVQRPRPTIWGGGKGDRAIATIAGTADGWNAAWFQDPEAYAERAALVEGRDIRRSIGQYAQGSSQQMVDRLKAFEGLGVEHAVMCFSDVPFGLDNPDDLSRFAHDVLPHVR